MQASWSQLPAQGVVIEVCQNLPGDRLASSSLDGETPYIQARTALSMYLSHFSHVSLPHISLSLSGPSLKVGMDACLPHPPDTLSIVEGLTS